MLVHVVKPGMARETEMTVEAAMTVVRELEKEWPVTKGPETVVLVMDASERWQEVVRRVAEALKASRAVQVESVESKVA